ncbi:MAG: photosynthetic reaction center cytochrome PufC [Gemmatimonadota bacterium]|nr:photosynthetic reaction center cytochrome c subunit [Gemmatimonadota bacterium]
MRFRTGICTLALVALAACERPPMESRQLGWRGLGLVETYNPRLHEDDSVAVAAAIPINPGPTGDATPAPPGTWQNVQVLGDLSVAEFNRTMLALTTWVSPTVGCNYCHVAGQNGVADFASDEIYTKVVSREMLRMVKDINTNWASHVSDNGVTCWTCHAGNPVPENFWYYTNQNQVERHYLDRDDIRVQSDYALASEGDNRSSIKQTEFTYAVMMNMSNALGVNCTYCHQSARWSDWEESSPARLTALRGLRMVREANLQHMLPLQGEWPAERLGPRGDGPKLECATCHQERFVPNYRLLTGADWPALHGPAVAAAAAPDTSAGAVVGGGGR